LVGTAARVRFLVFGWDDGPHRGLGFGWDGGQSPVSRIYRSN